MATSPDTDNYSIPTGYATFLPDGDEGSPRDLGNIVNFSISNEITKKDHFRSRGGRRTKDKTITTQVGATIKFTMDEITADNVAFFALSEVVTDTDGVSTLDGLSKTEFVGTLKIIGDNEVGTQIDWEGKVSFTPSGDFSFIKDNDDFNQIAVEANVEEDDTLGFGKWTIREPGIVI
jgi:hypothetical protein